MLLQRTKYNVLALVHAQAFIFIFLSIFQHQQKQTPAKAHTHVSTVWGIQNADFLCRFVMLFMTGASERIVLATNGKMVDFLKDAFDGHTLGHFAPV